VRRLHRVADILPVPLGYFADQRAAGAADPACIALVGADLLAADVELIGPVDRRN